MTAPEADCMCTSTLAGRRIDMCCPVHGMSRAVDARPIDDAGVPITIRHGIAAGKPIVSIVMPDEIQLPPLPVDVVRAMHNAMAGYFQFRLRVRNSPFDLFDNVDVGSAAYQRGLVELYNALVREEGSS